ncbi:antitoxin Xre/MbcA/ParS toxin-binding domain-containing protein [Gloeocapsopsis dulcis]|uniref:Uncharacterized protein n=1 Tax=Gloeocapsopsis dulcis AAB1 = 1H9 TaxID=1433147 RepID=A0A6N8FSY1_9CHRO|nr:antitoxin Xre/MbcA/ParS toxin-binding domain-containing protein [Gloeocapsopsis dulcis]MUL36240.1 hypothetical protein [Gloeocapsopsis dulcis AAB1 = 1H9]WNN89647.1 DUF2384 domain-containing protein [Gloeocapsopsis dulcis]
MLSSFLTEVIEPDQSFISPHLLSSRLHISLARLSAIAQVHRNTLTRHPESPDAQQRLGQIVQIVAQAAELIGDEQRASIWFRHQPLSGFDNKTAEELVAAGHADAVFAHLAMLSDGAYA